MAALAPITVQTTVQIPVEKAWLYWNQPEHITKWSFASDDWHSPFSENKLEVGKSFKTTMAAKDGSMSFDFEGVYTAIELNKRIEYELADGRKVKVIFETAGDATVITETFDPETTNPVEMQQGGWQAILDNFSKYATAAG